jgi:hypothetical protein
MPRHNSKARPRPKRKSVAHLYRLVAPRARVANQVFYALGSAPLPGSMPTRNGGFVRVFAIAPDTASRERQVEVATD